MDRPDRMERSELRRAERPLLAAEGIPAAGRGRLPLVPDANVGRLRPLFQGARSVHGQRTSSPAVFWMYAAEDGVGVGVDQFEDAGIVVRVWVSQHDGRDPPAVSRDD